MFGGSRTRERQPDSEHSEPLLSSSRDNQVLFDTHDSDGDEEHSALDASKPSVRFKDDVQVRFCHNNLSDLSSHCITDHRTSSSLYFVQPRGRCVRVLSVHELFPEAHAFVTSL